MIVVRVHGIAVNPEPASNIAGAFATESIRKLPNASEAGVEVVVPLQ